MNHKPEPFDTGDAPDPLEEKLRRLRPRPVSDRLRSRIGEDLAKSPESGPVPATPKLAIADSERDRHADPTGPMPMPRSTRLWWGVAAGVVAAVTVGWFAGLEPSRVPGSVAQNPVIPGTGSGATGGDGGGQLTRSTPRPDPIARPSNADAPTLISFTRAASIDEASLDRLLDKQAQTLLPPDSAPPVGKPLVF